MSNLTENDQYGGALREAREHRPREQILQNESKAQYAAHEHNQADIESESV
jgi:hypothetical protein